jgi:hypothetical protein
MSRSLSILGTALLPIAACGHVEPPPGSVYQWEKGLIGQYETPIVALLVVDDGDAPEAVLVRDRVLDELNAQLTSWRLEGVAVQDPAAWNPVDQTVVIAFPSALRETRLVGPFRYVEVQPSEATQNAFMDAVRVAMGDLPSEQGAFLPLETFDQALGLVQRSRPPESAAETTVLRALPEPEYVVFAVLAAGRDDEGTGSIGVDRSEPARGVHTVRSTLVPAGPEDGPFCSEAQGTGRLAEWIDANYISAIAFGPECTRDDTSSWPLLPGVVGTRYVLCVRPPGVDPDGRAACELTLEIDGPECDETRGLFAMDGPVSELGRTLCELRQHAGADLEACRTELNAEVPSGWCWTDVADFASSRCAPELQPLTRMRMTGSARLGREVRTIRCSGP